MHSKKSASSGTGLGRREQHLDRRHFTGEVGEVVAELWQGVAIGGLEQWQQRFADDPALVAYAVQQ